MVALAPATRPALHAAPLSTGAPAGLAALVRAYRESPTPARLSAVEAYAAAHSKETNGALARLALAVTAYEQKDYAAALSNLRMLSGKLPSIADYTAYYLGAARVESNDVASVEQDLAPVHGGIASPFAGRAWLLQARALKETDAAEAVRLLCRDFEKLERPQRLRFASPWPGHPRDKGASRAV